MKKLNLTDIDKKLKTSQSEAFLNNAEEALREFTAVGASFFQKDLNDISGQNGYKLKYKFQELLL